MILSYDLEVTRKGILSRDELRTLRRFNEFLLNEGVVRYSFLIVAYLLSYIPFVKHFPIFGPLIFSIRKLYFGFATEVNDEIFRDSNSTYQNEFVVQSIVDEERIFDFIIVGSGPGAAVAALKMSETSSVLVLEQGLLPSTPYESHHTLEHVKRDFYKSGQELIVGPWTSQFTQACVFGGGSEVNSGLYHRLPEHLLPQFSSAAGISSSEYTKSENSIFNLLNPVQMDLRETDSLIYRGCSTIGLEVKNIPRWREYAEDGKFQQLGMNRLVWSEHSQKLNFSLLQGTKIIHIDNTSRKTIKVYTIDVNGNRREFVTKNLIMAAGTTNTPSILAKSGIIHWREINFQWHPMFRAVVNARIDDLGFRDVDPFQGWTEDRQIKVGSAVSQPGLLSYALGRRLESKEYSRMRSIYVSFVSSGKGGLIPNSNIPWYVPSELDKSNSARALDVLGSVINSSGTTFDNLDWRKSPKFSTVHIFGSLPVGGNLYLNGSSRLSRDERIQISDASLVPHGPGVNPQGVVMTLCDALVTG